MVSVAVLLLLMWKAWIVFPASEFGLVQLWPWQTFAGGINKRIGVHVCLLLRYVNNFKDVLVLTFAYEITSGNFVSLLFQQ